MSLVWAASTRRAWIVLWILSEIPWPSTILVCFKADIVRVIEITMELLFEHLLISVDRGLGCHVCSVHEKRHRAIPNARIFASLIIQFCQIIWSCYNHGQCLWFLNFQWVLDMQFWFHWIFQFCLSSGSYSNDLLVIRGARCLVLSFCCLSAFLWPKCKW